MQIGDGRPDDTLFTGRKQRNIQKLAYMIRYVHLFFLNINHMISYDYGGFGFKTGRMTLSAWINLRDVQQTFSR